MTDRQQQLLLQRDELQVRLEKIKRDIARSHSSDFAEQAQERENDEVLQEIGHETETAIARINAALKHLEEGSYGICTSCGDPIHEKRMEALPDTTLCVECTDYVQR